MSLDGALQMVSVTDAGKVRSHNEDYVSEEPVLGLAVLADGMGGYNAGEVASSIAAKVVMEGLGHAWRQQCIRGVYSVEAHVLAHKLISEQVERANWAIFQKAQNEPQCAGMGTTLVVSLFFDDHMTVAHIGDSRMYRLRGETFEQVTKDHSLLQEHIDSGMISKEQARMSRNKNLLTRAVGIDPQVQAEIHTYPVQPHDVYMLCSDGLSDMVEDEEIRLTLLALNANLPLAAQQLVQSANDNGGRDNVSVVLIKVLRAYPAPRGWLIRLKSWLKM